MSVAAISVNDTKWMNEALSLARRGVGKTHPNPSVGAVVTKSNRLIGKGYHRRAGGAHAEILALHAAGKAARGATLYVTLEPCCTHGRTPACTDAILGVGIRRVVLATRDPSPEHNGRGASILRHHGVDVTEGICKSEAKELIAPFAKWTNS